MLKILVPIDYSPESKNALSYAINFAHQTQSKIIVHHAMPIALPAIDIPYESYYFDEEDELHALQESVNNFISKNKLQPKNLTLQYFVNSGNNVCQAINEAYNNTKADLVIMGTHGASGIKKYLIGSNTSNLIGNYQIPVLSVPYNYSYQPIYHIVYASDLKNLGKELGIMLPIAKIFEAVLDVFYFDYATNDSEQLMLNAEKLLNTYQYKNIKLTVFKGKLDQTLSKQILTNLNNSNTQILSLYRGNHNWLESIITGSTTQQIVMECSIPVLVIKKQIN